MDLDLHPEKQLAPTKHRLPLSLEEIPLPEGGDFQLDILRPEVKKAAFEKQEALRREQMRERILLYSRMQDDPGFRKLIWEKCKRSCEYFIDMFIFTYDDRADEGVVPMILYPMQRDKLIQPYERLCKVQAPDRVTIGVAKSRAIGYTWVSLAARVWRWLFHDNWSILIGGESRDDVDDGGQAASTQSLFGKLRFMIRELPEFAVKDLLGPNWVREEYNARNRLVNPLKPRNLFHGKQMSGMFGRGRRYAEVWADEVAHCEEMENAETSLKQTTNRFTFGSTPKGKGNFFYQAMHGSLLFQRFYIWWAENPYQGVEWYNKQREQATDDDIAQELDISFSRSAGGRVLHEVTLEKWFTDKAYFSEHLPLQVVLDPGWADHFAAIWHQWDRFAGEGRIIDMVMTNRRTVDWIVPFIIGRVPDRTYKSLPWPHRYTPEEERIIKLHGRWLDLTGEDQLEVFGDDAGKAGSVVTGSSAWDELEHYGIYVIGIKIKNDEEAIRKMNLMMRHIRFADYLLHQVNGDADNCASLGDVVTQWRYPKRKRNSTSSNNRPVHNMYSHPGDCIKMLCQELEIPDADAMPVEAGKVIRGQNSGISEPTEIEAAGIWRSQ